MLNARLKGSRVCSILLVMSKLWPVFNWEGCLAYSGIVNMEGLECICFCFVLDLCGQEFLSELLVNEVKIYANLVFLSG